MALQEAERLNKALKVGRVPIVSVTGRMALMRTIAPAVFVDFKRWMATLDEGLLPG